MNAERARDQLALSGMVEIHVEQPASASIDDGVLMKEFLLGCSCQFRLNDFDSFVNQSSGQKGGELLISISLVDVIL